MPSIPFVSSAGFVLLGAGMQLKGHPVIAACFFLTAVALLLVGEVARARNPDLTEPDAVWVREHFCIRSTIELTHSAQHGKATLTVCNRGKYPINVGGTAQVIRSSFPNNPIDKRQFSLRWHDDAAREVTIKPGRLASLLLGTVEPTSQGDAKPYEWFTLAVWEFGKERAVASQLWRYDKEELRFTIAVEVHCVPPASPEPTPALFDLALVPPTANLEVRRL
jgi:hypothetical protein